MSNEKKSSVMEKYEILNEFDVLDYHSKAVHLRHKKLGIEVLHMKNDDEENLFAFAFRTPNPKSNGAAHILEHSVLCGSEKFPLKDPFASLSNQSVKTYLNAMTGSDKTVYPGSSVVKADYFNLMDVYGDAVFFPKLDKEIFKQEAHRLEVDDNGEVSIQGVVYNEMKGNYSDFDSVASDANFESLMAGTVYEKDSGGDPLVIPQITHEELVEFHKKWYKPDNCFVFLYGNIPTEEQLSFLQEKLISRLEEKYSDFSVSEESIKNRIDEFLRFLTPEEVKTPVFLKCAGPSGEDENKNSVCINWDLGVSKNADEITENVVLSGILINHDGSPLKKILVESGLGEDLSPLSGLYSSMYRSVFTVGLRNVNDGDEKKIESLVLDSLKKLSEKGIAKDDIDSIFHLLDYSNREIKRVHGPYALVIMNRLITGWMYGFGTENQIRLRENIEKIKKKVRNQKGYIESLIKEKLLDNQKRSLVVVVPSADYAEKRDAEEKRIIDSLMSKTTVENVKADCDALHEFQSKEDDTSCLPHLNPEDFIVDGHPVMNRVKSVIEDISGIPLFINNENTNGIIYFDIGFPCDVLDTKDFPLLPLFTDTVTDCGWKGTGWADAAKECALHLGHCAVALLAFDGPDTPRSRKMKETYNWCGRSWCVFRFSMLEEECDVALDVLSNYITQVDFSDTKRLSDILKETKNDFESSVIPDGHIYVVSRAQSKLSRNSALDEVWSGISQFFTLKKLSERTPEENAADFRRIFDSLKNGGSFLHITAESSGVNKMKDALPDLIKKCSLKSLQSPKTISDEDIFAMTKIAGEGDENSGLEIFTSSSQVGYAAECVRGSAYGTREAVAEEVCSHWLSNNMLWERIRTIGGAYGAFCDVDNATGCFSFITYRDPVPFSSCDVFEECISDGSEIDFSDDEVEKTIMGNYSRYLQPSTPRSNGSTGLTRLLFGITDEDREEKILNLLTVKSADIKDGFRRLSSIIKESGQNRVVLCGKSVPDEKITGKIISLPL
ncbi:MAG: insulinase family protein [Treponema sp.]|nr:insulinase family protein [Treponema sp.]